MRSRLFLLSIILLIGVSCQHKKATTEKETVAAGNTYTNPLLERGAEPWAIFHEGKYYYTQGSENRVILWETDDITDSKRCMDTHRPQQLLSSVGTRNSSYK